MKTVMSVLLLICCTMPMSAQWLSGVGNGSDTVRTPDRVGIGPLFNDTDVLPRFPLEIGYWANRPGDMSGGGASVEGDLFAGNLIPGTASGARVRLGSNPLQGFLQWNFYYSATGPRLIDATRAGYGIDFRSVHTTDKEAANALQNGVTIQRYAPAPGGGVAAVPLLSIDKDGNVSASGTINANYQDVAEWVPADAGLAPGTVVVLDTAKSNFVVPSTRAYDSRVAGVISERPGLLLGAEGESKSRVATLGRVRVNVDASQRAIEIGDLLVTSGKPGTAMVSEAIDVGGVPIHRPGTLIGKALEPLESGQGQILVLLSLQ